MESGTINAEQRKSRASSFALVTIVALLYTNAALFAATPTIEHAVNGGVLKNPFRDQVTFVAVLKCAVIGLSLLFSLVQAAVYRFVLRFLAPETELKFSRHWFFVLLGQMPYTVIVQVLFRVSASTLDGLLTDTWFRVAVSLIASSIYIFCVTRETTMENKRAIACGIILSGLNAAVIFAAPATLLG